MYKTQSEEETQALGRALGAGLRPGDAVLLTGDLGAGKSVLARAVAAALGVKGPMASPTFTLLQPYEGKGGLPVHHFDLYRLGGEDEFYDAGLSDYVGGGAVALIEWPLSALYRGPRAEVELLRGDGDGERRIAIALREMNGRAAQIEAALRPWEERA